MSLTNEQKAARITELTIQIMQTESRLENRVINNPKSVRIAKKNIKLMKQSLQELTQ